MWVPCGAIINFGSSISKSHCTLILIEYKQTLLKHLPVGKDNHHSHWVRLLMDSLLDRWDPNSLSVKWERLSANLGTGKQPQCHEMCACLWSCWLKVWMMWLSMHNNVLNVGETWLSHAHLPWPPMPPMTCRITVLKVWTMWLSIHDELIRVDKTWLGHAPPPQVSHVCHVDQHYNVFVTSHDVYCCHYGNNAYHIHVCTIIHW